MLLPNPVLIKGLAAAAATGGLGLWVLWTVVRRGSPQAQTPSRCRLRPPLSQRPVLGQPSQEFRMNSPKNREPQAHSQGIGAISPTVTTISQT